MKPLFKDDKTYPRTVFGIGYQIEGGGSTHYTKIYNHWRDMLRRFLEHEKGYNTLNLAHGWECFDTFRDWYLIKEIGLHKLKSRYLVFLAPEFLPKRMKVGGKVEMIVSPKFGPKTCTLSITKPPTWRKARWVEARVRDKETKEVEDKMVLREGTKNAQRTQFFVPMDTVLYRRKKAAIKIWSEYIGSEEDRIALASLERTKDRNTRELMRIGRSNLTKGATQHYNKIIAPAQALQGKQLLKARAKEAKRLAGLDDVELRIKQRGIYRGLGYIGEGKYPTRINKVKTRAYNRWMWILDRCYKNCDRREDTNMYLGYRLGKKFLCFQDFAKWFEKHDRPGSPLPTFIVKPNSNGKLVLGPKNTKLMF
ncbi:MAG: hypothetical protein JKX78_03025 [Alteromonadaceae bacterium]|nr:hypothetical protein [Alteromonadaceae bacterium]